MNRPGLSIIIPTYNEAPSVTTLVRRIVKTMFASDIPYEIIFVDDHSTDLTRRKINALSQAYPIKLAIKKGKRGKGYSILQGFGSAIYDHVAMLDADLQYPPEILPELYEKAKRTGIGVARRKTYQSTLLRTLASRLNAFVFGKLLLQLNTDVQSGCKIFPAEAFRHLNPKLIDAWAIDLPLLYTAYDLGYTASHIDIDFRPRKQGNSNVRFFTTAWQIAMGAAKTRLSSRLHALEGESKKNMTGAGMAYRRKRFITHTTLPHTLSAVISLTPWQQLSIIGTGALLAIGIIARPYETAIIFTATISAIYFTDVLFNLYVIMKSLHHPPELTISDSEVHALKDASLPVYSVLCPLYREASVLPQFVEAMNAMDWPKSKLDILLLLEEDDTETISAARAMDLPANFSIVIVPHSQPKTKPKACNYGLAHAKGEYIVVYDAEDKPDPLQLKKAYVAFSQVPANIACLQAKLNYYNPHDNLLTRLFTAEYSLWFDVVLPGLQSIQTTIPLGGTSNHFRTKSLVDLHGWDPFNVTEDADLGARLFTHGYKTAIINSTTLEEANSSVSNWFRQRSRWIKGYIQTYFVHFRNPLRFAKNYGRHALLFQLIVGGKIAFMLINPLLWVITISYFALYQFVGPAIEAIYPAPVFYMAAFSLVFGNIIYLYNYMIGVAKREQWELVKYVLLIPVYWLMISIGAAIALVQFFFKPYYWEKTIHGLHLDSALARKEKELLKLKSSTSRAARIQHFADRILNPALVSKGILVLSSLLGSILNFAYNAYLGRHASLEDFGVISLMGSFLYIANVPLTALSRTVTHKSAYLFGQLGHPVRELWVRLRKKAYAWAILLGLLWGISTPLLSRFFHTENIIPFILFTPVWIFGTLGAVDGGFLGGNLQFRTVALLAVSEAIAKIVFSALFVSLGFTQYVYAAIPLSLGVSFAIGWWSARRVKAQNNPRLTEHSLTLPRKFYATSVLGTFSSITFLSLDLMLAKHYLSPSEAGAYSFLTMAGKMVYFLSSLATQFSNPLISHDVGSGRGGKRTFVLLLGITGLINLLGFVAFGLLGFFTVPLLWGPNAAIITAYLPQYTLAMVGYSITNLFVAYHQIRGEYSFSIAGFVFSLIQLVGMFLFHDHMQSLVHVVFFSSLLTLTGIVLMHVFYEQLTVLYRNLQDFVGLFSLRLRPQPIAEGKYRILIMNWYDARHAWAGGAEQYIDQIAKRWAAEGHEVTFFCGNDQTQRRYEKIDGVSYIRRGGQFTVALWAFIYYITKFRSHFDVVIDVPKGVPFFTPLYAGVPVICLIHQVHQDMFRTELRFPIRQFAMFLEAVAMPFIYQNTPMIAVSNSTKSAVEKIGLGKKSPITIVNPGIIAHPVKAAKTKYPSVLYLGRLRPYKFVDLLIIAVSNVFVGNPDIRLTIAGRGEDEHRLRELVKKLDMQKIVTFKGRVSDEEKAMLYRTHWINVQPSMVEGWGITNIEANYHGTPVIAANTDGLRDSVRDNQTGLLVTPQDPTAIEKAIVTLIKNTKLRKTLSINAKQWATGFTWDTSATLFLTRVTDVIATHRERRQHAWSTRLTAALFELSKRLSRRITAHPVVQYVFEVTTKIF